MALSFEDLKKNRGKKSLEVLSDELKKLSPQSYKETDERIWYPEVDKVGNGYAVIRFLPAPEGEVSPFVKVFSHSFKGPTGSWYIENDLNTIGQDDPVGLANRVLWNSGTDEDKETAKQQKRRLTYYSNILVLKDPANPENENTVRIFKYGQKIFEKIKEKSEPIDDHDEPMNPFDPWEGMDFKIKIRQKDGYRNYDSSEWASPSVISDDDKKIEAIWKKCYSLKEFIDPKNFKSFDELKAKYEKVIGEGPVVKQNPSVRDKLDAPKQKEKAAVAPKKAVVADAFDDDIDDDFLKKIQEAD